MPFQLQTARRRFPFPGKAEESLPQDTVNETASGSRNQPLDADALPVRNGDAVGFNLNRILDTVSPTFPIDRLVRLLPLSLIVQVV
jgi:hypothetical protein